MTSPIATGGAHVPAAEGLERRFGPNRMQFKIGQSCGAERLSLMVSSFAPGGGYPFLHAHRSFEEAFYVIEGELEFQLGGEHLIALAGGTVFVPPGVPHRFKGVGAGQAKIVVIHSSPDALRMIEEITQVGLDREKHADIFLRHDSYLIED